MTTPFTRSWLPILLLFFAACSSTVNGTGSGRVLAQGEGPSAAGARRARVARSEVEVCLVFNMGGTTLYKEGLLQECLRRAQYCPDYHFATDSNRTADNAKDCLDVLATRPLTDVHLNIFPACRPSGNRPDGAGCAYSSQCQSGQCGRTGHCSTCLAQPGVGSKCPDTGVCRAGSYCNKATGLCADVLTVLHAAEGEPCNLSASPVVGCQGDLYCLSEPP